jgi:hypothetical protein
MLPCGRDDVVPAAVTPGSEALLRPFPPEPMEAYRVGSAVGNVKNKGLELVEPLHSLLWLPQPSAQLRSLGAPR